MPSHCAWCVFPLLSTLISAGFAAAFLLSLWVVTGRIAAAAINKQLVRRVRAMQVGWFGAGGRWWAWPQAEGPCFICD